MQGIARFGAFWLYTVVISPSVRSQEAPDEAKPEAYLPWRLQMPEEPAPDPTAPVERWYGWETLILDGGTLAISGVAGFLDAPELAVPSLGMLLIGAPLVHLLNDNSGAAAISFGMRLGSTLASFAGLMILLDAAFDDSEPSSETQGAVGLIVAVIGLVGMVGAIVVDSAHLAFVKEVPARDRAVRVLPWIDHSSGRAGLSVALAL